jgi:hypothetical protein
MYELCFVCVCTVSEFCSTVNYSIPVITKSLEKAVGILEISDRFKQCA